jgi:ABC-type lipoprotein release transport system permease subunit
VIRQPSDLAAGARGANEDTIYAHAPPAWWAQLATMYRYGVFTLVWTDPAVALRDVKQSVRDAVAPSAVSFEAVGGDAAPTVGDAIDFEVWAARVFAIVVALAVVLLLGQAVSRQVERESRDVSTLRAIGLTRRQFGTAAVLRWSTTAGVSVATAIVVLVLSSPIAPIGLARRTIVSSSISIDVVVAVVTAIAIVALMLVFAFAAAWRSARLDRAEPAVPAVRPMPALGPAAATGLRATVLGVRRPLRSNTGSAIIAITLVTMTAVAGVAVVASYDALVNRPAEFGAPWDAVVGNIGSPAEVQQAATTLDSVHGVRAAAGILDLDGVHIGQEPVPLIAFLPIGQQPAIGPSIAEGRAPRARGEVALGSVTMDDLGLEVGDHVVLHDPTVGVKVGARVVGRAVVNNTYALEPGNGGVIESAWARELLSAVGVTPVPQQIAVQVEPGQRAAALHDLRQAFPSSYSPPVPSTSLRNLHRLRGLPWALVGLLLVLAVGVTLHALISGIRHRRPELAVLRALGFTTRATRASLLWQTAALSLVGAVLGTVLGLVAGRVGWHELATTNGVDLPTTIPVAVIALIGVLAVLVPIGLVVVPAVRESRRRVGEVLRVE